MGPGSIWAAVALRGGGWVCASVAENLTWRAASTGEGKNTFTQQRKQMEYHWVADTEVKVDTQRTVFHRYDLYKKS